MQEKVNWKRFSLYLLLNVVILSGIIAVSSGKPKFIKVNNAELVNTTDSFFNFHVSIALNNPNYFSICGKDLNIKFSESGKIFGEGVIEPFCMKKASVSDLDITMKLNYRQVIRLYNAKTSDTLIPSISISGSFMPFFFISKINLNKKIPRTEIFRVLTSAFNGNNNIKADSFSIEKLGARETRISFAILFTNNVNLTYSIREVQATLYHSEHSNLSLGTVSLPETIVLRPNEKASVPMQLEVDNVALFRALMQSGLKNLTSFFARGDVLIEIDGEQIRVPFAFPFKKPTS